MLFRKANRRCALRMIAACIAGSALATSLAAGPASDAHDYSVLLIGNSHSSRANLPHLLEALLEAGVDNAVADVKALGRWAFLAERLNDNSTRKALDSRSWTHVVL